MDKNIPRNILYRTAEAAAVIATSIGQYAALTHYLPLAEVGKYSLVLTWIYFISALSYMFGIGSVVTRDLTQGQEQTQLLSSALVLQFVIAVLLAAIFLPLISLLDYFQPIQDGLLLIATGLLITLTPFVFQSILSSREEMGKIALINSFSHLTSLVLLLLVLQLQLPLIALYAAYLSCTVVQAAMNLLLTDWKNYLNFKNARIDKAYEIFKEATPIVLFAIVASLYVRIDVVMIDWLISKDAVAQYTAAYNFLDYLMILSNTILTAVFPNFTRLAATDMEKFKILYKNIIRIFAIYLVPIALLIGVFAPTILELVYGEVYSAASLSLRILMLATLFAWLNGPSGTIFIALNEQKIYLWGTILSLILNVLGNLIFIPIMGYSGAALATVLTEIALCSFCLMHIHKRIGYLPFIRS